MKTRHLLLTAAVLLLPQLSPAATQTVISGPPGSQLFGTSVTTLPNGNILVKDPYYDRVNPPQVNVGAVYLYSPQGDLISTLIGSTAEDQVGVEDVVILANGHFVLRCQTWDNGAVVNAGAVTFGHAETGFGRGKVVTVSATNSLVGTRSNDFLGSAVNALTNGHYVVSSPLWDNGAATDAGAVTWGNGFTGISGPVTPAKSLVGTQANDLVGNNVTPLTNGHYVVGSPVWDNGAVTNVGAVTWGHGDTGISGPITPANSLLGTQSGDQVGAGVTPLTSGHYVVRSPVWDNGPVTNAGAVTWGHGQGGTVGQVTPANSLVGSSNLDLLGVDTSSIVPLTNGHYIVKSLSWNNGAVTDVGAVTWGNGFTGISGPITPANSLVGTQSGDQVGFGGVTPLTNGHYVVCSPGWNYGVVSNAGAVTWGHGFTGITGHITPANSLVGSQSNDNVGSGGVTPLTNGHYVVRSPIWDNAAVADAGAVTWGHGTLGTTGLVTPANSLVGTTAGDQIGKSVTPLTNGHYVVASWAWANGDTAQAGAVTWSSGSKGVSGTITPANSLVGSQPNDQLGSSGVVPLTNGNYVALSPAWHNGGAATWGNGTRSITGTINSTNSLVGALPNDNVGASATALTNGHYVVNSPFWANGAAASAGAITWGNGQSGIVGPVTPANSLVGSQANDDIGGNGGNGGISAQNDGNYVVWSTGWDNGALANAGVVSLGDGETGTVGQVDTSNSVPGSAVGAGVKLDFAYDPIRKTLVVGDYFSNQVTIFTPTRPYSLAKAGVDAPGAVDIAFAAPGALAVDAGGGALFEAGLTGSGARTGKRGLFAPGYSGALDLVLRQGDAVAALGLDLPGNAVVASLGGPLRQQAGRGLFQATVKGAGVTAVNNRLLLLDDGIRVRPLLRSGQRITLLFGASMNRTLEVAQSHDQDAIAVTYVLNKGGSTAVTGANDTGLLLLRHDGSTQGIGTGREGAEAFGGGGTFGQFTGRVAAGQGDTVHFSALYQPNVGKAVPALFRTTLDGGTRSRTATVGDAAPGTGGATFASFKGLSQMGADALFTATLKGSPANANEGLWRDDGSPVLTRKGDAVEPGVTITRLLRFWPAGSTRVLLHAQLSDKTQALVLRQENGSYLILLRSGQTAPGVGAAKLRAISAVDVDPVTGHYAVLGTLSGAPAAANQALWSGNAALGDESAAGSVYRLPVLRLRKGQTYRTESTPQSVLRGISLRPAVDTSGAGGRGLAQVVGSGGAIGLVLTGDRKLSEVVVLK